MPMSNSNLSLRSFPDPGDLREGEVKIASVIEKVVDEVRKRYRLGGNSLRIDYNGTESEAKSAIVITTPHRMYEGVLNVIDNAIRHGLEHEKVELEVRMKQGSTFQLTVKDRGPGLPEKEIEKLNFTANTISAPHDEEYLGKIKGLPLSMLAARLSDGVLKLKNREGGGLAVIFELPVERAEEIVSLDDKEK